jgi:serine/threonine protein kinase
MSQVHDILFSSDTATVASGTYNGLAAIFKLFGPDRDSLAVYRRELAFYKHNIGLQQLGVIPRLFSTGQWPAGVSYLALSKVPGIPYSQLKHLTRQHVSAALQALSQLHSIPGMLHGDLHPGNMLLLHDVNGRDTDVRCVLIDFGSAKLDASEMEQQRERKSLEKLMQ